MVTTLRRWRQGDLKCEAAWASLKDSAKEGKKGGRGEGKEGERLKFAWRARNVAQWGEVKINGGAHAKHTQTLDSGEKKV